MAERCERTAESLPKRNIGAIWSSTPRAPGGGAFKKAGLILARRYDCRSAFDLFDRYLTRPL
jgi:hypothetical protein